MKKRIGIALAIISAITFSCASPKGITSERETVVKTRIENKDFTINIHRAVPTGGRSVNLTTPYSVSVQGDSVYSYLPYFGRAYNVPYGGGNGLVFEAPITRYESVPGKKGSTTITFDAISDAGKNQFKIDVYPGGSSAVTVIPAGRQTIYYDGNIDLSTPQ